MRALRASQAFEGERFKGPVDVVFEGERVIELSLRRHRRHDGDVGGRASGGS